MANISPTVEKVVCLLGIDPAIKYMEDLIEKEDIKTVDELDIVLERKLQGSLNQSGVES